jgi:hypothetical protein
MVHLIDLSQTSLGGKVAVVFISMGDMARDPLVDYAVASVRNAGEWRGEIYILTDKPVCFSRTKQDYNVTVVTVPKKSSIMQIKALKPQLLELVPSHVQSLLYLDVDIVVTRELNYFLSMVGRDLISTTTMTMRNKNETRVRPFDFAAFGDAKGHYVGFCAGCEKWHTGVMVLRRGQGTKCLKAWADILSSGRYSTDQESLDRAERQGSCKQAHMLPTRFILFAKDYIAALLTTGHTFVHVTSAGRMATQDSFYKSFVVPRFRAGLADKVDPKILDRALGKGIGSC